MNCSPPGSSFYEILQARILEWVAMTSSRGSSSSGIEPVSLYSFCIGRQVLCHQHHSSKSSILQCSAFFMVQLSHLYMTTGKTRALTIWTFVGKMMSLPFYALWHTPRASLVIQLVKNLPAMWEIWVWSLGWEDLLGKGKATYSSRPGEFHGLCSPWGCKELDTTEWLHFQNHCRWWLQPWNLKTLALWKKCYNQPRQHINKQRHYFANKGPSSQSSGFSSSHVWMLELDYKESWASKKWCFWNFGVGEDSWEFLGLQGHPTSPP